MIPVRITLPLYIRSGAGRDFGELGVAPASGKIIQMDGVKEDGHPWKGISKWYFKINDKQQPQWYWGGRVEEVKAEEPSPGISEGPVNVSGYLNERFDGQTVSQLIDYNFLLNIDRDTKKKMGEGTCIGILDHPISKNIGFKNEIIRPLQIDHPAYGHANFIAGIMAGRSSLLNGICSSAKFIELAFFDQDGNIVSDEQFDILVDSVRSMPGKVIINVSQTPRGSTLVRMMEKFGALTNAIFVSAAGSDAKLQNIDHCFLVDHPNTISVGSASSDFISASVGTIDKKLHVLMPVLEYVSFDINGISFLKSPDETCSWATAVVSSLVSLLLSENIINNTTDTATIVNEIHKRSKSYPDNYPFLNSLMISQ